MYQMILCYGVMMTPIAMERGNILEISTFKASCIAIIYRP